MFEICPHPDPRPAVQRQQQGLRIDGRFAGFISRTPDRDRQTICNLIIRVDDWTVEELRAWLAEELGRPVAGISRPPLPPGQPNPEGSQNDGQKSGFFQNVWRGIWGDSHDRW